MSVIAIGAAAASMRAEIYGEAIANAKKIVAPPK
jgi:hypothetical protein